MARVLRSSLPDGYFHVYARGIAGVPIFPADQDRTALLALSRKAARAALSSGMQWLNSRYPRAFNKRYDRFGSVFAERFQTRVIEREDRVFDTCAYVLLNPVKAGLCDRVEDWPWSYSRFGLDVT